MDGGLVKFDTKARKRAARKPRGERRYPARIARQLALAHNLQRRVDIGEFADYADMARSLGFTRARISQLMDLLLIAPAIQEEILFLEMPPGTKQIAERELRKTLLQSLAWNAQQTAWSAVRASLDAAAQRPETSTVVANSR